MPKAKYEFQKLVCSVEYSQAFETKSLKIWKTSNFSMKNSYYNFCILLYFSLIFFLFPLKYGMAQFHISHENRSSILLGKSKIFVSMRLAGISHLSPALGLKLKQSLTGKIFVQTNKFLSARMDALCLKPVSPLQN